MRSHRDGDYYARQVIESTRGKTKEPNGTFVEFIPDHEIFKKYHFQSQYVLKHMWHYAYLNTGLTIRFNGEKITYFYADPKTQALQEPIVETIEEAKAKSQPRQI